MDASRIDHTAFVSGLISAYGRQYSPSVRSDDGLPVGGGSESLGASKFLVLINFPVGLYFRVLHHLLRCFELRR